MKADSSVPRIWKFIADAQAELGIPYLDEFIRRCKKMDELTKEYFGEEMHTEYWIAMFRKIEKTFPRMGVADRMWILRDALESPAIEIFCEEYGGACEACPVKNETQECVDKKFHWMKVHMWSLAVFLRHYTPKKELVHSWSKRRWEKLVELMLESNFDESVIKMAKEIDKWIAKNYGANIHTVKWYNREGELSMEDIIEGDDVACVMNDIKCENCQLGKEFGICINKGSYYDIILEAIRMRKS